MNIFNKHGHKIKSKGPWPSAAHLEHEQAEHSTAVNLLIGCSKLEGTWGKGTIVQFATETLQLSQHMYMHPHVQKGQEHKSAEQQLRGGRSPVTLVGMLAHALLQRFFLSHLY